MANEIKEIGEFVRKCKILLLDIEGTTTSISFVKDKLFPYAEENVKKFLESQWENDDVKEAVNALRKLALEDTEKSVDGAVAIPGEDASKEDQIEGVVNNVKWQMSSDRKAGPLKELQGMIWKQGYDNGDIKGHVFDDVSLALEQWHSVDGQKVYIYSSGSVQAQKLLFGQSLAGDLLKYIDGHFDTAVGGKQESDSYKAIVEKIGCNPDEILFLTDILKEAEAARGAGLHVVLVSREGNAALPDEASAYPLIHSLGQLTSNKRKTDPQEADLPAKIPKTDTTEDSSAAAEPNNITETSNESEKMDVEDVVEKPREDGSEKESDDKVEIQESATVIEEVTDVKGVPVTACDIEPIITEVTEDENSKKHEIEKMDTDSEEKQETIENGKTECKDTKISELSENSISENAEQNKVSEKSESTAVNEKLIDSKSEEHTSISEETPPIIITEIEEIKDDKELLCDVADVIEDVVPIVEEPVMNEDIEELQNVGDVLEKECDEILSKVQDVTNLDSIPVKPLLNPIVEESMETENTDSNDIVDRILDRELELEMKQSAEVVQPVEVTEGKNDNNEISKSEVEVTEGKNDNNEISKSEDSNAISKDQHENKETITGATKEINSENGIDKEEPVNNVLSAPEVLKENSLNEKIDSQNNDSENKTPETKTETLTEEKVELVESEEGQINGKATNGETEAKQNGDTGEDEELKSRLSAENGKEIVNGSNGDSLDVENRLSDKKTDSEATEIKVKTIATEEPSTELIEQPTEA